MTEQTKNAPTGYGPVERRVRPLSPEAAKLLQEIVQRDPLLRRAWDARCEPKTECRRGPFGCDCGRKLR